MVEMTIRSRFYYKDKLCEVDLYENAFLCEQCIFVSSLSKCRKAKCNIAERHDGKYVCFKEVKE